MMSVDDVGNETVKSDTKVQKSIKVVPWYNAAQFKKVYQYLYSDDVVKKRWAYDTICVWETRCHPSLPTAIEATYVLTSAVIQDILWTNQSSLTHHTDIQSIYSAAIIRFVSLTVEVNQDPSNKQSLTQVAKGLGISSSIIDVRNECCHSYRPSLSVLRLAAQAALKYLKESYWEKEAARVENEVKEPMSDTKLKDLLKGFVQCQYNVIKNYGIGKKLTKDQSKNIKKVLTSYEEKCESWIKKNRHHFIKVLVSDDLFIPLEDDLKCLVPDVEFKYFQREWEPEDEPSTSSCDVYPKSLIRNIPCAHEKVWVPIISLLNKYDAVPIFIESLLRSQGDRTSFGQKLITAWVSKILRIHDANKFIPKCPLRKVFRIKGIVINWHSMAFSAVVNPCKYTGFIFPLLFKHLDLAHDVTLRLFNLMAIYIGQMQVQEVLLRKSSKVFTVEELKRMLALQRAAKAKRSGKSLDSVWSLCPDDRHKSWQIGSIINAVENEDNEEQPMEEDNLENFTEKMYFTEKFLPSNENDKMNVDKPDVILPDMKLPDIEEVTKEMSKRKTLLYKK